MAHNPAAMIRVDLDAAEMPYRDDAGGVADFHALRHTFVSRLAMSQVPVKVIMELARHSSPTLTLGGYAHVGLADAGRALDALPSLRGPDTMLARQALQATGTDNARATQDAVPRAETSARIEDRDQGRPVGRPAAEGVSETQAMAEVKG